MADTFFMKQAALSQDRAAHFVECLGSNALSVVLGGVLFRGIKKECV
jgi:hypothetical protein